MYALIAIGLNVVVGSGRTARPRLRRLLRRRRLHGRAVHQPGQPVEHHRAEGKLLGQSWAWLALLPVAILVTALSGLILGFADAAVARRLPGDRDPRVRRDRPAAGRQPRRPDRRRPGPPRSRFPQVGSHRGTADRGLLRRATSDTTLNSGVWWFWLSMRADHHRAAVRREPRALSGRPGLGRDPGGRGRRRDHGGAHLQVQAVGVRDRRVDRRHVRRAVRRPGPVRGADQLQRGQLGAVPLRRRARRPGQQARE